MSQSEITVDTEDAAKSNKQTLKQIAAMIKSESTSESTEESENSTEKSDTIIEVANNQRLKTPICYSVNQVEVLQTLGNYTFVAQNETGEFIQKIVGLLKKSDTTNVSRLPTLFGERKVQMLELGREQLRVHGVHPKTLRPEIIRSLHYGHPGRDTMLATVSNICWPRLHRKVVSLAKTCPQCQQAGKNIKTVMKQKQIGNSPK